MTLISSCVSVKIIALIKALFKSFNIPPTFNTFKLYILSLTYPAPALLLSSLQITT